MSNDEGLRAGRDRSNNDEGLRAGRDRNNNDEGLRAGRDRNVHISVTRLDHAKDLALPAYATEQSAGLDLLAAISDAKTLAPNERALIPTGLAIALPDGYEAQIRPRSGLALKHGISLVNSPGTIDADYRGEVGVIIITHGTEAFTIERGMRIAQMVIAPYSRAQFSEVLELPESKRGAGGFGSTGTKG